MCLAAIWLTSWLPGCNQLVTGQQIRYRTTEGVTPLSWELKVWNANKSTLQNTITDAAPGGIAGGFKWQLRGTGDTVQLDLSGINARMKLPPRGVVQLKVDGNAAFYGIVPDPPSGKAPDVQQAQVLGGREALRVTLMDGKVYRNQGVYDIVRDILNRLCPPALTYSAALVGNGTGTDTGPTLSTYYAPTADLVTALDSLAKSAGVTWGVDSTGAVFFGRPSPAALSVAYAGQPWERLPVQGREVVTRSVLRVVTSRAGEEPKIYGAAREIAPGSWGFDAPYLPATITKTATAADHAAYAASRAFEPPEGVALTKPAQLPVSGTSGSVADAANATDGNDSTFSTVAVSGGAGGSLTILNGSSAVRVVGFRLVYELDTAGADWWNFQASINHQAGATPNSSATWALGKTQQKTELLVIFPPHIIESGYSSLVGVYTLAAGTLKVYALEPIVIDETAAANVAASFLQPPYATPSEIKLKTLQTPTPTVTVTGTPDGDVTGGAGLWEYEHSVDRVRTTLIRIGTDGQSSTARAIKFAVQQGR